MILDYRKVIKIITEIFHTPHPVSPNVNILLYEGTFVKPEKPILIYYYQVNSRLNLDFIGFPTNVLVLFLDTLEDITLYLFCMLFYLFLVYFAVVAVCFCSTQYRTWYVIRAQCFLNELPPFNFSLLFGGMFINCPSGLLN